MVRRLMGSAAESLVGCFEAVCRQRCAVDQALPEPLWAFDGAESSVRGDLDRIDALKAQYRQEIARGGIHPNAFESVRVELTYHSNAIEGSTLSLRETQMILEGVTPPGQKPMRELYEARNHDRALRMIERWCEERVGKWHVTEEDLLAVHAAVLTDIDAVWAGRYRSGRVLIAGSRFVPPGPHKFPELISASLQRANGLAGSIHPVLLAAESHYSLVAIHPFVDGNGRTARLMMNLALLRAGYPLGIIEIGERARYLAALDEANEGRVVAFAGVVIEAVERSLKRLLGM